MTQQEVGTIEDWLDGERDAKAGVCADPGRSERYQLGYSYRYQLDECIHMTKAKKVQYELG